MESRPLPAVELRGPPQLTSKRRALSGEADKSCVTTNPRAQDSLRINFKNFANIAEVTVGPKAIRFLIHRELLTLHSPFFHAALTGTFAEGLSQTITLPEERVESFEFFVYWLYTQRVEDNFKEGKPTYFVLLELYELADRLAVEGLRNQVVDKMAELAERTNSVLTPSDTHLLYERIRDSAPMRKLVLDLFAFKKTDNLIEKHQDDWHPDFMRDLVVKLKRPGAPAMMRHTLQPWKPGSWTSTKACEVCRAVLRPHAPANTCVCCGKAFCGNCASRGAAICVDWPVDNTCKPWRSMCYYHEHIDTPGCTEW
ncbi:hypothetical protein K402DRAFT_392007 [Aulographum hederae CBS 113979]|uniref:BTB domain-containing protein n=1 Tax=Aulographum hederae CBS 113979 TaxID=1176131 RepID=A0A6G1H4U5_9PEZI|nr:hypothetical protein K402DRAFT_392007 [Aulographum hederae CBS 113979]